MRKLVLLLILASCHAPEPSGAGAAGESASCSPELCAPYTCDAGFDGCRTTCETAGDCTDDYVCERGVCMGTECNEATATFFCGGYACVNGSCASDCALGPCAEGYYCRGDTNACVPKCTSREDVSCDGYLCDVTVGECEPYCLDDELACAAGYICDGNHACVRP